MNPKISGGGDKRTPAAKVDIAKREERIVALRLRRVPFTEIGRAVGVSRQAAQKAFYKALRRNTDQDIHTYHRSELAELDIEQTAAWEVIDAAKDDWKAKTAGLAALSRIHIRRARLLGLDAPQKLDLRDIYRSGSDELSAERSRLSQEAILEALPIDEQVRWYEVFTEARKRAEAGDFSGRVIETTVSRGTEHRTGVVDPEEDDTEHSEG